MGPLLIDVPVGSLDEYLATDTGGLGLQRAVELGPDGTIDEVLRSGLRGRGGGGFATGRKWRSVRDQPGTLRYAVGNGAEGEPGTFKDRSLVRTNPYQLVEGMIIAAFAVGASEAFIALKASFTEEIDLLTKAAIEMQEAGICTDCTLSIVGGPDEYLFGEEKALLEVVEGKPPLPRLLPPHEHGLFASSPQSGWEPTVRRSVGDGRGESNPTLVNNVETLSNVPHVLARGADWFRSTGTDASPGTQVCTFVGDVETAAVVEVEMGTPLAEALQRATDTDPSSVKAVFSGVANPVVTASQLDVPISYEGFDAIGSGMGAAGFVVYGHDACMVEVARQFSRFLYVESCGQCPACKRGSGEITARLEAIEAGAGDDRDITEIGAWLAQVTDGNRCYLAVEEQTVVSSVLRAFPEEFAAHLEQRSCPRPRPLPFPKVVDVRGGVATYDTSHARKRPDWTYGEEPVALRGTAL